LSPYPADSPARRLARALLSPRVRRAVRIFAAELPHRVRDFVPDLRERGASLPLPPARLRRRVGIDGSREHFLAIGRGAARDITGAIEAAGLEPGAFPRWLDFGCGCGRVARHLTTLDGVRISGVDIDEEAIAWCNAHLGHGLFSTTAPAPPAPFADASFDLVYSVSVFTHLDEAAQFAWLAELRRILRPGGVLVVSTHAPELVYNRPDLTAAQHIDLRDRGFTFATTDGPFNDDSAFHSRAYLERQWTKYFTLVSHRTEGLNGYQDLSVWRRGANAVAFHGTVGKSQKSE
jgi:SAM-dependent methyltransferase